MTSDAAAKRPVELGGHRQATPKRMSPSAAPAEWADHPAVLAWATLHDDNRIPDAIEVLKSSKKMSAYRLYGLGPRGECVIVKHAMSGILEFERLIYEEVLPALPLPSLHCYGFLEEGLKAWLFLEDAEHGSIDATAGGQWTDVARWLGELHGSAANILAGAGLPDRGPSHYLEHLRASQALIGRNLDHPAFSHEDRMLAERLLLDLAAIEARWPSLDQICQESWNTLVHGDLMPKNLRLRVHDGKVVVLPFDWETAGWGVPAADLAGFAGHSEGPEVNAYLSALTPSWPQMDVATVQRLARVGYVFRLLASIYWAARGLNYAWAERSWRKLTCYQPDLRTAVTLDWES
jgi:hypothetical protein